MLNVLQRSWDIQEGRIEIGSVSPRALDGDIHPVWHGLDLVRARPFIHAGGACITWTIVPATFEVVSEW